MLARLVLPAERDPKNLDQPLTTLLRGDAYQTAGRWQRLELRQPQKLIRQQQQLLRAELSRDVNVADAYVDQLILNVYAGPGLTESGPTTSKSARSSSRKRRRRPTRPRTAVSAKTPAVTARAAEMKLQRAAAARQRQEVLPARHPPQRHAAEDAARRRLQHALARRAGRRRNPSSKAVNLGFWLVPMLRPKSKSAAARHRSPGQLTSSTTAVGRRHVALPGAGRGPVLGPGRRAGGGAVQLGHRTVNALRTVDPLRPVAADVWDGFQRYSRGIDQVMLGVHRWPLMTGLELPQYRDWLTQRRQLAQPGTFWTWVQTHLPDWFTTAGLREARRRWASPSRSARSRSRSAC